MKARAFEKLVQADSSESWGMVRVRDTVLQGSHYCGISPDIESILEVFVPAGTFVAVIPFLVDYSSQSSKSEGRVTFLSCPQDCSCRLRTFSLLLHLKRCESFSLL